MTMKMTKRCYVLAGLVAICCSRCTTPKHRERSDTTPKNVIEKVIDEHLPWIRGQWSRRDVGEAENDAIVAESVKRLVRALGQNLPDQLKLNKELERLLRRAVALGKRKSLLLAARGFGGEDIILFVQGIQRLVQIKRASDDAPLLHEAFFWLCHATLMRGIEVELMAVAPMLLNWLGERVREMADGDLKSTEIQTLQHMLEYLRPDKLIPVFLKRWASAIAVANIVIYTENSCSERLKRQVFSKLVGIPCYEHLRRSSENESNRRKESAKQTRIEHKRLGKMLLTSLYLCKHLKDQVEAFEGRNRHLWTQNSFTEPTHIRVEPHFLNPYNHLRRPLFRVALSISYYAEFALVCAHIVQFLRKHHHLPARISDLKGVPEEQVKCFEYKLTDGGAVLSFREGVYRFSIVISAVVKK